VVLKMKKSDRSLEQDVVDAFEKGKLKSVGTSKAALKKYRLAAQATFIKNRRVNIRLSSPDLMDIQARALEEGVPYQTLIASVLHKFVTGRFIERPSCLTSRSARTRNERA
jgi:predicted DNA binding CopG/RHH family protein